MDVWSLHEFRTGLWFGAIASGALVLACLAAVALRRGRPLPIGGVVIAAGGLWSIAHTRPVPNAVVVGVVGIGASAALPAFRRVSLWYSLGLAVPFAWAIAFHGDVVAVPWAQAFATVAASGGAILVTAFDHAWREEAPGLTLLAVSAVGIYATVPDTETIAAALGVMLPFLFLGWPFCLATLGRPGAAAAVAMLVWAGAVGARGRPTSIVGVAACLGLLVGVPLGQVLVPRAGYLLQGMRRELVLVVMGTSHLVIVVIAARTVGRVASPVQAAVIAACVGVGAVAVGSMFRSERRRCRPVYVQRASGNRYCARATRRS